MKGSSLTTRDHETGEESYPSLGTVVLLCLALILVFGFALVALQYPLNPDVGWFVSISRRMLSGEQLYVDIVEVNPPLVIYLMMPAVLVADTMGLSDAAAVNSFMIVLLSVSIVFSVHLIFDSHRHIATAWWLVLFGFSLFIVPAADFGQREHLLLALTIPFILIKWRFTCGSALRNWERWLAGIAGGIGFALKPHFLFFWIALEALAFLRGRERGIEFRVGSETIAVVSVFAVYASLSMIFHAAYLRLAQDVAQVYGAFGPGYRMSLLVLFYSLPLIPLGGALYLAESKSSLRLLVLGLCVYSGVGLWVAFIQSKGWSYHFLPSFVATGLALGVLTELHVRSFIRGPIVPIRIRAGVAILFLAVASYLFGGILRRSMILQDVERDEWNVRVAKLAPYQPGSILILGDVVSNSFPLTNILGARSVSPFASMWWIRALYAADDETPELEPTIFKDKGDVERKFFQQLVRNFVRDQPDLLLVDTATHARFGGQAFPYLDYFSQDSAFATGFKRYTRAGAMDHFVVMTLAGE